MIPEILPQPRGLGEVGPWASAPTSTVFSLSLLGKHDLSRATRPDSVLQGAIRALKILPRLLLKSSH